MPEHNKTTEPTYSIREVRDFLKVPPDRREDCLHEFAAWLACDDFLRSLSEDIDAAGATFPAEFVWVDDGERRLEASFSFGDERLVVLDGVLKERAS